MFEIVGRESRGAGFIYPVCLYTHLLREALRAVGARGKAKVPGATPPSQAFKRTPDEPCVSLPFPSQQHLA